MYHIKVVKKLYVQVVIKTNQNRYDVAKYDLTIENMRLRLYVNRYLYQPFSFKM